VRLHLIRHPEPDIESGTCYGALDVPAKPATLAACLSHLLTMLPTLRGLTIFSSPLKRCLDLAKALHAATEHSTLTVCPALGELDFGRWEGISWDSIYAQEAAGLDAWAAQPLTHAPGGGESLAQLHQRVTEWLKNIQQQGIEQAIVVTHGGPLRVLLSNHIAQAAAALSTQAPPWGSLSTVEITIESTVEITL
jgi:alpha-ribazole phosphatase